MLQGSGTELAACAVNYGAAERIEAWIRAPPSFRGKVPQYGLPTSAPAAPALNIADELAKLAQLRAAGVLSAAEFEQAKARLLR